MLVEQYRQLLATSRIENFRIASGRSQRAFEGIFFNDSDVYKWVEAAAWFSLSDADGDVARAMEDCVDEIIAAQQPDGFLHTYYSTEGRDNERWGNLRSQHQLYCAGHLFQAAVAHYRSTGTKRLLDAARRFADCICLQFGPASEGKQAETDGHPEIEMALVELYRATRDKKYLRQAEFFVDVRGRFPGSGGSAEHQDAAYFINHAPYREVHEITGHAVRALYLAGGATDIFLENGDATLLPAIRSQWSSFQAKKRHVSGGAGSRWRDEAFGDDYELPQRGYCETCAAIASVMWSQRLFALDAEPGYMDSLEWTLFNAVLPGVSRSGKEFFYQNPLVDNGKHRREEWFGCACCPPNVARLLASLPSYAFSVSEAAAWIHLPLNGETTLVLPDGQTAALEITGTYPFGGEVAIEIKSRFAGTLAVRIPGWCENTVPVAINGTPCHHESAQPGSYFRIQRDWQPGDRVQLSLDESPRLIEPHPHILDCHHLTAVARGPFLYCTEAADNPGIDLRHVQLLADARPDVTADDSLPPGVVRLLWPAINPTLDEEWNRCLYRTRKPAAPADGTPCKVALIPYFCWGNREPGRMQVWQKFVW